jgi:hypothetical protein
MDFSDALIHLKAGDRISRGYWPAGDKALYLADRTDGLGKTIYFSTFRGSEGIWIPSNADLLAEDWVTFQVPVDES